MTELIAKQFKDWLEEAKNKSKGEIDGILKDYLELYGINEKDDAKIIKVIRETIKWDTVLKNLLSKGKITSGAYSKIMGGNLELKNMFVTLVYLKKQYRLNKKLVDLTYCIIFLTIAIVVLAVTQIALQIKLLF